MCEALCDIASKRAIKGYHSLSCLLGFMTREERKKFESLHSPYNKYWIPCVWFTNLVAVARCEGRVKDDSTLKLLLEVGTHTHKH